MSPSYGEGDGSLVGVLRAVIARMQHASAADIVALYPWDAETETFYAPTANGISDEGLLQSLPDMADQLRRYRVDVEQGKAPEDVQPAHYGSNVWLLVHRRPLITADAPKDIDSSFIRRNKIQAVIGLPLLAGAQLVALLYLDYLRHEEDQRSQIPDPAHLEALQEEATQAAIAIQQARKAEELAAFRATADMIGQLSAIVPTHDGSSPVMREHLEQVLVHVTRATSADAAAVYVLDAQGRRLDLVAQVDAGTDFPTVCLPHRGKEGWDISGEAAVTSALQSHGLYELAVLPLRSRDRVHGTLVLAGRDRLTLTRKPAAVRLLLQAAADLIGGALENRRLVEAMEESNRTFSALSALSVSLLQPGATQDQVLSAVVARLTDPTIPEFDFQFATVYLLEEASGGGWIVRRSAGATSTEAIDSVPILEARPGMVASRIPRWVLHEERAVDPRDVLSFVSRQQRTVVIAAKSDPGDQEFVRGFPEAQLERLVVPIARDEPHPAETVRAVLLRTHHSAEGARQEVGLSPTVSRDLQLQGDLFDASRHADLIRVFVPFRGSSTGRLVGVLEAGYHISRKRQLERLQIEALSAAASQVAVAVETARLYEDAEKRAEQLEVINDVSRVIASSLDLDETLKQVARNMTRVVDASICLVALFDDDGSAWYGAAASEDEDLWRRQRVERPEPSILFEVADRGRPLVVEDCEHNPAVRPELIRLFGIKSVLALPLFAPKGPPIGAVALVQRDHRRTFTTDEVLRASAIAQQAALAIQNASLHAREEEEQHIQKDFVLIGFGQWGQKAYQHLLTLKQFFNFKTHIVEQDREGRRAALADLEKQVIAQGDALYWDSPSNPAMDVLMSELEPSCYVITYIATPAETHLPVLKKYYDLSNVVLIEKPLGAPLEEYRAFLDSVDGSVQLVAADHYYFKLEVRLLQLLLTEERTLKEFLDDIEEIEIQVLESQPPGGSGAQIGMIADLVPHAFAILSLLTPLDRLQFTGPRPLYIGRYQPETTDKETYVRLYATFPHKGRRVRVVIDAGKGVTDAKWIKLSGERRAGGKRSFYKFDFGKGVAIDGTQVNLRAATRHIRQPGVPDNAHISMLRHVIEKKYPAVGILAIREAMRSNQRIQELETLAAESLRSGHWTPYEQGQKPQFDVDAAHLPAVLEPVRLPAEEAVAAR